MKEIPLYFSVCISPSALGDLVEVVDGQTGKTFIGLPADAPNLMDVVASEIGRRVALHLRKEIGT